MHNRPWASVVIFPFAFSGNILIETIFFDGDFEVSRSRVRIYYVWANRSIIFGVENAKYLTRTKTLIINNFFRFRVCVCMVFKKSKYISKSVINLSIYLCYILFILFIFNFSSLKNFKNIISTLFSCQYNFLSTVYGILIMY